MTLGAIQPAPAPPLEVTDLGDGTQRVTSTDGGYTVVIPSGWLVSGDHDVHGTYARFGQAHMSSYDPRTAPQQGGERGSIMPPDVGIRLDIEVWANPAGESVEAFAKGVRIGPDQVGVLPGSFVTVNGLQAHRATIQDERRFQPQSGPLMTARQTRALWVVPTPRPDRLLVIYATPAESPLLSLVERAVETLEVTAPVKSALPVIHQRSEILERWLTGKAGPIAGRRVEAKLMTYVEASVALSGRPNGTPNGILRIDRDPEELFWLVAVSGPGLPEPRGGPMGRGPAGTAQSTAWMLYTTAATADPNGAAGTGRSLSAQGTWPPGFDALPDRCH